MQGFKETEIGWIPENWDLVQFGDTFRIIKSQSFSRNKLTLVKTNLEIQNIHYGDIHAKFVNSILDLEKDEVPYVIDKFVKSESNQFLKNGDIIITDVSEDLVDVGKCVELKNVGSKKVIGGLHTIVARDKLNRIQPGFGAYIFKNDGVLHELRSIATGMSVYGISKGNLAKLKIPIPPKTEQTTIAHILSTIQKAIEKQQQLIDRTTELKKALMHKLFTEGTKGEPQKETEIGLVPESWEVVEFSSIVEYSKKPRNIQISPPYKFIPMAKVPLDDIYISEFEQRDYISSGTFVRSGDLLLAKITPSFENGKQGILKIDSQYAYATTEIIPFQGIRQKVETMFLFYYLKMDNIRTFLADKMEGSTGRQRLAKQVLDSLLISLPQISEQIEIYKTLNQLDYKIQQHLKKKTTLESLFKTMLHELMTGKTRVKDVEFEKGYKIDEPIRMAAEPRYEYK